MKKIQKPIYNFQLDNYEGNLQKPELTDIIEYSIINDKSMNNKYDFRIVFDCCKMERVTMNKNEFKRSEFFDCTFENCDFSNNSFINSTFIRCQFINCRFTGSHFIDSFLKHIAFKDCIGNLLDMAECKLEFVEFSNMNLLESNFYTNKMKQVFFNEVNLEKSTFYETSLKNVDLRTCDIYDLKIDDKSIRGSIISSFQAPHVCYLLGIIVKD